MKETVPLAKNILAKLGITTAGSAIDAGIQEKIHGSGTTTLTSSNKKMNDIMKTVQDLEDSNILLKGVTKTIKNETKKQKGGFVSTFRKRNGFGKRWLWEKKEKELYKLVMKKNGTFKEMISPKQ